MSLSAILHELESTFPPVNPCPSDDLNHIMYKAGQRSVVEWIQQQLKED